MEREDLGVQSAAGRTKSGSWEEGKEEGGSSM